MQVEDLTGVCSGALFSYFPDFLTVDGLVHFAAIVEDNRCLAVFAIARMDQNDNDFYCFDMCLADGRPLQSNQQIIQTLQQIKAYAAEHGIRRLLRPALVAEQDVPVYLDAGMQIGRWSCFYDMDPIYVESSLAAVPDFVKSGISYQSYDHDVNAVNELCLNTMGLLTHGHFKATGNMPTNLDTSSSISCFYQGRAIAAFAALIDETKTCAYLDPLLVDPEYRRTALFSNIISRVCQSLIEKGVTKAQVQILEDNKPMVRFVERLKGLKTHRRATLFMVLEDG
ncbi:MAG: GNAT family N-acetyltransferase [Gammaproteobacteria bacterium]|nr:GNAT family N-acetyltransferase [Gammaproteobacteria bacterium]